MRSSGWTSRGLLACAALLALAVLIVRLATPARIVFSARTLAQPTGGHVTALAVHPQESNLRLVATTTGLFRTSDKGATWERAEVPALWNSPAQQILFDATLPSNAYALGAFGLGISADAGLTWNVAAPPTSETTYLSLVQSSDGSTLYIVAADGLLRSTDHGDTWHPLPISPEMTRLTAVVPHPTRSGTLIAAAASGVFSTADRGETWQPIGGGPQEPVDWLVLAGDAAGKVRAHCSEGTYELSQDALTWTSLETTTPLGPLDTWAGLTTLHNAGAALATVPEAAAMPEGLERVACAGAPVVCLGAGPEGLLESSDSGQSWAAWGASLPAAPITHLAAIPNMTDELVALSGGALFYSTARGETWERRGSLTVPADQIRSLVVSPDDADSVLLQTTEGTIVYSADGGQSWVEDTTAPVEDGALPIVAINTPEGAQGLCVLAQPLRCRQVPAGAWFSAGLPSDGLAVGLFRQPDDHWHLVLANGEQYQSEDPLAVPWEPTSTATVSVPLVAAVSAADGNSVYGLSQDGTLLVIDGNHWRPLGGFEVEVAPQQTALLAGRLPMAVTALGADLLAWDGDGTLGWWPSEGNTRALVAASGEQATDFWRLSEAGVLSRITLARVPSRALLPALQAGSILLAVAALGALLWPSVAPRAARHLPQMRSQVARYLDRQRRVPRRQLAPAIARSEPLVSTQGAVALQSDAQRQEPAAPAQPAVEATTSALGSAQQLAERLGLLIQAQRHLGPLTALLADATPLRMNLPAALPIVAIDSAPDADVVTQIRSLITELGALTPFALVIVSAGAREQWSRLAAEGMAVLPSQEVTRILQAEDPAATLSELLQEQLPLQQISPFVVSGPVPATMFYGREYQVRALLRALFDKSIAIVGGRRLGKTSFLNRIHEELLSSPQYLPILVDCHHVADTSGFLSTLSMVGGVVVESASADVLRRVVMRLRAQQPNLGQTVVLELDEVDNLLSHDMAAGSPLFGVLRSLSEEGLCRFILAGERVLDSALKTDGHPLHEGTTTVRLGRLETEDALRLVREPVAELGLALQDATTTARDIVSLAGNHPNILQALCQLLIERVAARADRVILNGDLDAVRTSDSFRDLFFDMSWGNASTLERLVSVLMAPRNSFTPAQVRMALEAQGIRVPEGMLQAALDGLVLSALIAPRGNHYVFSSPSFGQVLRESGLAPGFRSSLAETLLTEMARAGLNPARAHCKKEYNCIMRQITITADNVTAQATLNDSSTANAIWDALPITARANTWGDEIYFGIPVHLKEAADAQEVVALGDLGYWAPGHAFCIFFGRTPMSRGNEIRPASAVNVFGKVEGDPRVFTAVRDGASISITRSE